jgi:hypothetical protein
MAVRVRSGGGTAQCGIAPDLCRRQSSRSFMIWEKRLTAAETFVSPDLE